MKQTINNQKSKSLMEMKQELILKIRAAYTMQRIELVKTLAIELSSLIEEEKRISQLNMKTIKMNT